MHVHGNLVLLSLYAVAGKIKLSYLCSNCGSRFSQWQGRCSDCDEWNTLHEQNETITKSKSAKKGKQRSVAELSFFESEDSSPNELGIDLSKRILLGYPQLDRVLGGGFVPGSLLLFGGDPGIGKSTLLLQVSAKIASLGRKVLYASGEESRQQVLGRAKRLKMDTLSKDPLLFLATTSLEELLGVVEEQKPEFIVVDSVQTISSDELDSQSGSVSQVKQVTSKLMELAKTKGITIMLVGHVTKDGAIAGPKVLEHMVDGVFYFELSNSGGYRFLRAQKNRFGATNELAVLEMTNGGLEEVTNPSQRFMEERARDAAGTTLVAHVDGSQTFFVEFQSLTQKCFQGYPRRTVQGVDQNRISLLLAICERHLGVSYSEIDVFCKVASGHKIDEPAADLAMLFTMVSAYKQKAISAETLLVGEVGLAGEVRSVHSMHNRLKEASQLGIKKAIIPEWNVSELKYFDKKIQLIPIKNVVEVQLALEL